MERRSDFSPVRLGVRGRFASEMEGFWDEEELLLPVPCSWVRPVRFRGW